VQRGSNRQALFFEACDYGGRTRTLWDGRFTVGRLVAGSGLEVLQIVGSLSLA
jgi:hypothetical protein